MPLDYVKMKGSKQKCHNTGNREHQVDSQHTCEEEAKQNKARYYSYSKGRNCFYSTTCSSIKRTQWKWDIYEARIGSLIIRISQIHILKLYTYVKFNRYH